jgi:FAD/FMN-containing dehydrogenase/Fe-S oxidoreductase
LIKSLQILRNELDGELEFNSIYKKIYATDASVYRKYPIAVAFPKSNSDIKKIIAFASDKKIGVIPRTAGTSLAGQCVGEGIVVDVSKYLNKIISVDTKKKTVTVQPGVIRDELNRYLLDFGLFFGPNTSTSQFCMIGGMVGNNSSGTTSIKYGVTRDKLISLTTILSDGSEVEFKPLNQKEIESKINQDNKESSIYTFFVNRLSDKSVQDKIKEGFPDKSVHRRNTGYAIDTIIDQKPFNNEGSDLNLSKLLAGSEGTLAFSTSITLSLEPLPPKYNVMLAVHFKTIRQAMESVVPAMKHDLFTCELIDKTILDCTLKNPIHKKNRFFIIGDPKAILLLEMRDNDLSLLELQLDNLKKDLSESNLNYRQVELRGKEIDSALSLRHAGLGLLGNIIGDKKAVACIEDTAVPINSLASYISDFEILMKKFNQEVVYYAHAGAGELHLRPILNLKTSKGVSDFRLITSLVAELVRKYKGSLSGEHGDGIVRSEFIPRIVGKENYKLFKEIKTVFDNKNIFNPGKIIDPIPMDQNLRYNIKNSKNDDLKTFMNFSQDQGILRATEKCNGSGNCRSISPSGTLCPSYRATRDEIHNTRGRANVLREVLTNNKKINKFDSDEIKTALDLCLSCKACATECPSGVDIALYKSEFQYQYKKIYGSTLRDKLFAYNGKINRWIQPIRWLHNGVFKYNLTSTFIKKILKISTRRSIPKVYKSLYKSLQTRKIDDPIKSIYIYLDEFTNYLDPQAGIDCVYLLENLGYQINLLTPTESGRAYISKGFLEEAKKCAEINISKYGKVINNKSPLIGIEPSAIYTFKDEYLKLSHQKKEANKLAKNCHLIDSFISDEIKIGNIKSESFHFETKNIKIHSHCYQKALGSGSDTFKMLNIPVNYTVTILNTGCCGMAGSFGYEKEHYEISQKIGNERLFPSIIKMDNSVIIAANGTSCRHQILDGTKKESLHPVSILRNALI